jgi:multidrug efflux pump subunit AcrA (membrane-fusion protein)
MRTIQRIVLAVLVIAVVAAGAVYFAQRAAAGSRELTFSGTIEATETNLPTMLGGQVKEVYVNEGDHIVKGEHLMTLYSPAASLMENITAPFDGEVLERLVQPDEFAAPHGTVLVIAALDTLTLTIYVPEDRYGQFSLGQTLPVTVDSFSGVTFKGTVRFIADKAEFTPRNVQTVEGRKTTVFAVRLELANPDQALKPGMPADVHFVLP